jgi:hypothetical protein
VVAPQAQSAVLVVLRVPAVTVVLLLVVV